MNKVLGFLNIVGLVMILIVNALSQSDFFPTPIGELGQSRAVFFLPAAYVFSIWGVIYLGLMAFAFYQARHEAIRQRISWYFLLSCAANGIWLFFFLYNRIWESTIAMLVLLFSLLMIYSRLEIGQGKVSTQEKWFVHIPFSIYLGWISVATIANFSAALFDAGFVLSFLGISADIWAVVMMSIAAVLGMSFIVLRHDYAYALVIIWALIGIYARPFDTPDFAVLNQLNIALVHNAALTVAVVLALALGLDVSRKLMGRGSSPSTTVRAS